MKNGSTPRNRAGLDRTMPTAATGRPVSARAATFGYQPSSSAIFVMRSRVSGDTPVRPLRASDTALVDTPAKRAMSAMVVCGRTASL